MLYEVITIVDLRDIVMIRPDTFERERTVEIAAEVEKFNDALTAEGRRYVLIGPGRWGSSDRCRITSYNVCYTKLLRGPPNSSAKRSLVMVSPVA